MLGFSVPGIRHGKNTGVCCHILLQGIFLSQGSNLHLLHWQVDSLMQSHQGSPLNGHATHTNTNQDLSTPLTQWNISNHWQFPSFVLCPVQSLSRVWLFVTPWITARQASLSITNSWSSLRLRSIESVMPSSHLILCHPLLLLPPIPPSIRIFFQWVNSSHEVAKVLEFQL